VGILSSPSDEKEGAMDQARKLAQRIVVVVFVAVGVSMASLSMTPPYEAVAEVGLGLQQEGRGYQTLMFRGPTAEELMPSIVADADSRYVAQEVIRRLGLEMSPDEFLDSLHIEQVDAYHLNVRFEDTNPVEATKIANAVGQVVAELSHKGDNTLAAQVYEKASLPTTPASPKPLRDGLVTLAIGSVLFIGVPRIRPDIGARLVDRLGVLNARRRVRMVPVPRPDPLEAERIKETELLQALGRRGKLTVIEAAMEASLTVAEAERILQGLAAKGHLEVTVEGRRLMYSFWKYGA
jgi:capsular polysaccharide biosynthesis protein